MDKYLLSIDQGTTSCRAIVFDLKGKAVATGQKEFGQHFPNPGWVEHDANEIFDTQVECIKDAVKKSGIKPEQIAAVAITNQRETTVVWDKETGKPIHNAIVWQCRRTAEVSEALKDLPMFRERTGLVPDAYFSGPKIKWLLENVSGAKEKAKAGKLLFGTIDSWLIYKLTKEQNHLTEPSNASRTLVYNIRTNQWDDELLKHLDIPKAMMPKVVPSNSNFGTTNKDIVGFEAPIYANLGDQQAAMFGQVCFKPGEAKCTYGTGSFLLANIGSEVKLADGLLTTVAWQFEGEKPVYAFEGAIFIAGAAVQWLRDGLKIIESSSETEKMAKSLDSNDGVYFVPALVGMGSPWWNSDVRGTIVGLTRGSSREHFVRAALESMTYQVADVASEMKKHGINLSKLRVDGGATMNEFLLQFQSDVLEIPVERAAQAEATAWGVAQMAGLKARVFTNCDELVKQWQISKEVAPTTDRKHDYEGWKRALNATFAYNVSAPCLSDKKSKDSGSCDKTDKKLVKQGS